MARERAKRTASPGSSIISLDPMRPAPFRVAQRKEWITADGTGLGEEEIEGFSIFVRAQMTNAEKKELVKAHDFIAIEHANAWNALPPSERDPDDSPREREKVLLAPYIYGWNATGIDAKTGEDVDLPPPREAGPAIFDAVTEPMVLWMLRVVIVGYASLGKATRPRKRLDPTGDMPEPEAAESA